jgi:hypothetical protein
MQGQVKYISDIYCTTASGNDVYRAHKPQINLGHVRGNTGLRATLKQLASKRQASQFLGYTNLLNYVTNEGTRNTCTTAPNKNIN